MILGIMETSHMADHKSILQMILLFYRCRQRLCFFGRPVFCQIDGIRQDTHFSFFILLPAEDRDGGLRRTSKTYIRFLIQIPAQPFRQRPFQSRIHTGAAGMRDRTLHAMFFGNGQIDRSRTGHMPLYDIDLGMRCKKSIQSFAKTDIVVYLKARLQPVHMTAPLLDLLIIMLFFRIKYQKIIMDLFGIKMTQQIHDTAFRPTHDHFPDDL